MLRHLSIASPHVDESFSGEPHVDESDPQRCYLPPLKAHYLGDACLAFRALDADRSGFLELDELDDGLQSERAQRLMDLTDNNDDGHVDFNEFVTFGSSALLGENEGSREGL